MNLKLLCCIAMISLSLNCFCQAGKKENKTVQGTKTSEKKPAAKEALTEEKPQQPVKKKESGQPDVIEVVGTGRDPSIIIDSLTKELKLGSRRITRLENQLRRYEEKEEPVTPDDNNLSLTLTQIGLGVVAAIALILLTAAIIFYFKIKKMESENDSLKKEAGGLKVYFDKLKNNLQKNKLLRTGDIIPPEEILDSTFNIIDQYVHSQEMKKKVKPETNERKAPPDSEVISNITTQIPVAQLAPVVTVVEKIVTVPYVAAPTINYIKSEILLSAGPRKDTVNKDTELGEDVAGLISFPQHTFFWLLDGTSDSAAIKSLEITEGEDRHEQYHIFSSRLLAQSMSHYIQSNITHLDLGKPLGNWLTTAIDAVRNDWEARLNKETEERKEPIRQLIRQGYKPLCSTTIIFGRLLDNGQLYVLRTGDSKVFPFKMASGGLKLDKDFKFSSDPTDEYDRIAFRLDLDASGSFVIKRNEPKWAAESTDNVQMVFAFSDGIGRVTEAQLASDNYGIVESIRQHIARIPQKTYDDKTLIVLERIIY